MIEQAVAEILLGDTTIKTTTGGRIRPFVGAAHDKRPYVLFDISAAPDQAEAMPITGQTPTDHRKSTIEVTVYADTYLACASLSTELRRVLNGKAVNTSTERVITVLDDESDTEQAFEPGKNVPVFVRTQQYRALHRSI